MQNLDDLIPRTFFRFQNELKLYHWRTYSYARHVASDALYDELSDLIDKFVEIYMGKYDKRVDIASRPIQIRTYNDNNVQKLFSDFKKFLENLDALFTQKKRCVSDLLNIRDEMLGNIEQTLYRFTLR